MPLSDPFLQSTLEKIDSPDVIAVGIVGSYARGQEGQYRGTAALKLSRQSIAMFDQWIPNKHRAVINNTLQRIQEAGI